MRSRGSNYAWANPSTGIREQSNSKEEARLLVWREIQEASPAPEEAGISVIVYEQEPAGKASKENCTLDNPTDGMSWDGYAFANPSDGMRESYSVFIDAANRIAEQWPEHAPMESVVIYRQREAFWVFCDDPEPAPLIAAEIPLDTPSSLIDQVMEGTCADLQRASLLASLWIAQSLQEVAGALHYMSPGPPRRPGIFARIAAWWTNLWKVPATPLAFTFVAQKEPEPEAPPETPEQAAERRAREMRSRVIDPNKPHVFEFGATSPELCAICTKIEKHAIHGYTGE